MFCIDPREFSEPRANVFFFMTILHYFFCSTNFLTFSNFFKIEFLFWLFPVWLSFRAFWESSRWQHQFCNLYFIHIGKYFSTTLSFPLKLFRFTERTFQSYSKHHMYVSREFVAMVVILSLMTVVVSFLVRL